MTANPKHQRKQSDSAASKRRREDKALDKALEETFPASDPVAMEEPSHRPVRDKARTKDR